MEEATNVLFSIGPLEVTSTVTTTWGIILILTLISWLATRNLKDVPGVEYVYNKRNGKRTISAPQKVVHMTEVNGAYIFGQTPSVSP